MAGPTNLLSLTATHENDATYQCQFLAEFVHGNRTLHDARQLMIASSPLYFAKFLPDTQVHLAENDKIVPITQGSDLKSSAVASANPHTLDLFIYEGTDHQTIATNNTSMNDRIESFLLNL